MTLAIDRGIEWPTRMDRRGLAGEPRRSWASPHPVEIRATPHNDAAQGTQRWARLVIRYQQRAVVLDALTVLGVGAPFLVHVYGASRATAGLVAMTVLGMAGLVALSRGYERRALGDGPAEYQALLRAGTVAAVGLMGVSYTTMAEISRLLVFVALPLVTLAMVAVRHGHRRLLHRARERGHAMKRTLVVGEASDVVRVARDLTGAAYHGFEVDGLCLPSLEHDDEVDGIPVVGAVADVPQVVVDRAIDVVVVAGPGLSGEGLRRLSWALDRVGSQLIVVPDLVEVNGPRLTLRPAAGLSLLEVEVAAPLRRLVAKTVIDRVAGLALLVAAAPVIGLAALAVRLTSSGKAFYCQTRVGIDGETFTMWKIRSMYVDADARLAGLSARSDGNGVLFKMRDDPRVTPVGRFLRRFSLDELPQLLNVVRGDMSLVGPRPPLGEEVARYEDSAHRRLRVKPGLTGLWQVSGRSDLSWEESVRLDLRYVDNWSVMMDAMILWKTVRAVLRPTGAY